MNKAKTITPSIAPTPHCPCWSFTSMESGTVSKKSLRTFLEEERRSVHLPLPPRSSFGNLNESDDHSPLSSARTSCVSASSFPLIHTTTSPDSPWMCSPGGHTTLQPMAYHCLASLHRSEGTIFCMTVMKNFVITGSSSSRIHAWKQPDCAETNCIDVRTGQIRSVFACGNLLVSTHGDFRIRVWDVSSSTEKFRPKKMMTLPHKRGFFSYPKKKMDTHKDHISCVALNNVDMLVYTGSWDQTVKVWSITKKRCIDSFLAHDSQINAIVINQEDGCVFTCSSDGTVKIWRRVCKESSHILVMTLKFQPSPVNALAISNYSSCFLYSGSSDGLINFWTKEGTSGRYNHGGFLQGHHFAVLCLVTVQDLILSGSEDATIWVWRRDQASSLHSCVVVIDGHHGPVKCLAAVLEGNEMVKGLLVYSASLDQTMKVWRVKICQEEGVKQKKAQGENGECKMSPVLSPSWVEKKIQGSDY